MRTRRAVIRASSPAAMVDSELPGPSSQQDLSPAPLVAPPPPPPAAAAVAPESQPPAVPPVPPSSAAPTPPMEHHSATSDDDADDAAFYRSLNRGQDFEFVLAHMDDFRSFIQQAHAAPPPPAGEPPVQNHAASTADAPLPAPAPSLSTGAVRPTPPPATASIPTPPTVLPTFHSSVPVHVPTTTLPSVQQDPQGAPIQPALAPSLAQSNLAPSLPSQAKFSTSFTHPATVESKINDIFAHLQHLLPSSTSAPWNVIANNPLKLEYQNLTFPLGFKPPSLPRYAGNSDPETHLKYYTTCMFMYATDDALLCKCFPNTLADQALDWFTSLPANSIHSFQQLGTLFLQHFAGSTLQKKPRIHLHNIRQRHDEHLSDYFRRFNEETLRVQNCPEATYIEAFCNGLRPGRYSEKLNILQPQSTGQLYAKIMKWIKGEDLEKSKKESRRIEREELYKSDRQFSNKRQRFGKSEFVVPEFSKENSGRTSSATHSSETAPRHKSFFGRTSRGNDRHQSDQARNPSWKQADRTSFTPLTAPRAYILSQVESLGILPPPRQMTAPPEKRNKKFYCAFHRDVGHTTDNCFALKKEIESAIQRGQLQQYVAKKLDENPPANKSVEKESAKKEEPKVIHVISSTQVDEPQSKRLKLNDSSVCPVYLHDDRPLVISLLIEQYIIKRILVDTGSSANILYMDAFKKMSISADKVNPVHVPLMGFSGSVVYAVGTIVLPLQWDEGQSVMTEFILVDSPSPYNIILGRPALNKMKAMVSTYSNQLSIHYDNGRSFYIQGDEETARECFMTTMENIEAKTQAEKDDQLIPEDRSGSMSPSAEVEEFQIDALHPDRKVIVGKSLPWVLKQPLIEFLAENKDMFAWSPFELGTVPRTLAEHHLGIPDDAKPVSQKRRNFAQDRQEVIKKEVADLMNAGIVRRVQFPTWLANPVVVPKPDGSWRMCIDFTDLNKSIPKRPYPMPRIDQLVDATSGHAYLCFLDAYKGYHQICMSAEDEEKTSFITPDGLYCYTRMPFGLKNAGAEFQELVNAMLKDEIGKNAEAYIDDILIKTKSGDTLVKDISDIFAKMRIFGLKLNPKKCSFGVEAGKFLGYMVSQRGIEANPKKIKAILEMKGPRNQKELQRLIGKIVSLNRFFSASGEKALPLYQLLRSKKPFEWNTECDEALEKVKNYLTSPPVLVSPITGEVLHLYLAIGLHTCSSVLCADRDNVLKPVYYVSHIFQGPESRYSNLEKHALAVVVTSRRLKPYFQAHTVHVHTNAPIRRILHKPDASGRLLKWTIELTEFHIEYIPRKAIKAQILADFLQECTIPALEPPKVPEDPIGVPPPLGECWHLYSDGSSAKDHKGAGFVLKSPEGIKFIYALKYQVTLSNNESEYEAFLAGLRAAHDLKVRNLVARSDSQLLVGHINGSYDTKGENMQKYLSLCKDYLRRFDYVLVEYISRKQNHEADLLSKLKLDDLQGHPSGTIWIEPLVARSIDISLVLMGSGDLPHTWMDPIHVYIETGDLPDDPDLASQTKRAASRYLVIDDQLYRRAYSWPLLKCVSESDATTILKEIHEGICGSHIGSRSLARKVMRAGYFWPTMEADAIDLVKACEKCQLHANIHHNPSVNLFSLCNPVPFSQWGMDLLGPFPKAPGNKDFLVVAIDYFTKWVEAKPLASITSKVIKEFFFNDVITRFGVPMILITDNGTQFASEEFQIFCDDMKIDHRFTSVAHPQANGLVEVTNRMIIQGLKKRLESSKGKWVEELPKVLWSYRTTPHSRTHESPFNLCFGTEALLPIEMDVPSTRLQYFDPELNDQKLVENLLLLDHTRDKTAILESEYKRRLAKSYNKKVKPSFIQVGNLVLRKNEASRQTSGRKLDANWEGPYLVVKDNGNGSFKLEDGEGRTLARTWNACNLKRFYP